MESRTEAVLSPGAVFHGVYEVRRCLEAGGMAIVYEAIHTVTRRPCALKVLRPSVASERGMHERFALEARIPAEIRGEHIVEVFDAGVDEATGSPFIVMELLHGDDLETVLRRRGPLPSAEAIQLLREAASALEATHAARIVHRDLKPSNLFLAESASAPALKILDFGIAKIVDGSGRTTRNLGTPMYMSPEQVRGDGTIGPAADVYALGQVAFALLVGVPYWRDESASGGRVLFDRIEAGASESGCARAGRHGVELPASFDAWFERATAREPEDRFESPRALVDALAQVFSGEAVARTALPRIAARREATSPASPRSRARSIAAGVALLTVAGGAWALNRRSGATRATVDSTVVDTAVTPTARAERSDPTDRPTDAPPPAAPTLAAPAASEDQEAPRASTRPRIARAPAAPRASTASTTSPAPAPPHASSSPSPFGPGAF